MLVNCQISCLLSELHTNREFQCTLVSETISSESEANDSPLPHRFQCQAFTTNWVTQTFLFIWSIARLCQWLVAKATPAAGQRLPEAGSCFILSGLRGAGRGYATSFPGSPIPTVVTRPYNSLTSPHSSLTRVALQLQPAFIHVLAPLSITPSTQARRRRPLYVIIPRPAHAH